MSIPRTAVLLLLGTILGSEAYSLEPPLSSSRDRGRNRCYAVRIEAIGAPSTETSTRRRRRRFRRRFSAQEVLDLRFSVLLPANNQSGLVEIEIYTPKGNLYETLQAQVDPDDPSGGTARYRRRRARVVSARLPIAGSHITSRSLFGRWRAEVHLDGNDRRCRRPKRFIIRP